MSGDYFARSLQLLAAGCIGIFAGAMLTEGFLLVPWWRSLDAASFFAWYAVEDERLLSFFSPLTVVAALSSVLAALVALWKDALGKWMSLAASILVLTTLAMYFLHFQAANESFSAASIPASELPLALERWASWHQGRMLVSVLALAASLVALQVPE